MGLRGDGLCQDGLWVDKIWVGLLAIACALTYLLQLYFILITFCETFLVWHFTTLVEVLSLVYCLLQQSTDRTNTYFTKLQYVHFVILLAMETLKYPLEMNLCHKYLLFVMLR